jgi:hypothetical protein
MEPKLGVPLLTSRTDDRDHWNCPNYKSQQVEGPYVATRGQHSQMHKHETETLRTTLNVIAE